jgi:hypothetical protein
MKLWIGSDLIKEIGEIRGIKGELRYGTRVGK